LKDTNDEVDLDKVLDEETMRQVDQLQRIIAQNEREEYLQRS